MASTLETLNTIYEQVKNKDEWCQGALCKDGKMCLTGRVYSVNDIDKKESARQRLYQALDELSQPRDIAAYNDSHTHTEVVQLVVRAVAIERRPPNGVGQLDSMVRIS